MFSKSKLLASLALRLAVWYAGSAFLLLVAGTGFLYWELTKSFEVQDNQYLVEKATTLRKLLKEGDSSTLKWEVEGDSSVRPGVEVLSRVFTNDGRILLETAGMAEQLPASLFPTVDGIESRTIHNRPLPKHIFSVLTMQVPDHRIQVGLEVTFEKSLLAEYRAGLWTVLSLGLLLSAVIGYQIGGLLTAAVAFTAFLLPTSILTLSVTHFGSRLRHTPWARILQRGLGPLTAGLVLANGFVITGASGAGRAAYPIAIASAVVALRLRVNPLWIIAASGAVGALLLS